MTMMMFMSADFTAQTASRPMEGAGCERLERIKPVIGSYNRVSHSWNSGEWHCVRRSRGRKAGSEDNSGEGEELHFLGTSWKKIRIIFGRDSFRQLDRFVELDWGLKRTGTGRVRNEEKNRKKEK
jgi:hypothetical protein